MENGETGTMELVKSKITGEYIANEAFYAVLEQALKAKKWPANVTYAQIVEAWSDRA